jgi:hypothetical protein
MTKPNRDPRMRGFSQNGAPAGYGQQRGASPYLDQPQDGQQDERGARPPMAADAGAPAAPDMGQVPAWQQALNGGMQASTGSGAFGGGARMPQGYGQQNPNPAMNQQGGGMDQYGQTAASQSAYAAPPQDAFTAGVRNQFSSAAPGGDPNAAAAPPRATIGDPTRGAFAQYGDGNIAGTEGMATGNYMGQLEGFNTGAWGSNERGSNSIKNNFGKIASRYDVSQPGAVRSLMQDKDFQNLFPGAKLVEHPNADLIDFGDGNGPVDVIRGAVAGGSGAGWQWGANPIGGAPGAQGAPMGGAPAGGGDQLTSMMAALQGGGQGFEQGVSIEQIMAALGLQGQAQSFMQPQQPQR